VTDWPDYPPETRAALASVSQGTCYFPGCGTPIVVSIGDRPVVNVELVRIRESEPGRPRYVTGPGDGHDQSFGNLLLLCVPHRRIIGLDADARPIELLETWRAARQAGLERALEPVRNLTDDLLAELLATAFSAARERTARALMRLENVDAESASLLRRLADGPAAQRRHGADHATAELLAQMADRLGALEDRVRTAAEGLRAIEHTVRALGDSNARLIQALEALSRPEDRTTPAEAPAPKRANIGWTT
jgi:hypothetical protein